MPSTSPQQRRPGRPPEASTPSRDLTDVVLGDYVVRRKIGSGGMGEVYEARRKESREVFAIKVPSAECMNDATFLRRFYTEGRMASRIKHPNIVQTFEVKEADGIHYMAMEFVEGKELSKLLVILEILDIGVALEITRQLAEGLDAIHQSKIYHRDIKPGNIMISESGQTKLMDFGIAHMEPEEGQNDPEQKFAGTPKYLSPEQIEGHPVDHRADIYALGVVLYEMVTGRAPFDSKDEAEMRRLIVVGACSPARLVNYKVPAGVEKIIEHAMARRPEDRYNSAAEMCAALKTELAAWEKKAQKPVDLRTLVGKRLSRAESAKRAEEKKEAKKRKRPSAAAGKFAKRARKILVNLTFGCALLLISFFAAYAKVRTYDGELINLKAYDGEVFSLAPDMSGNWLFVGGHTSEAHAWQIDSLPAPGSISNAFNSPALGEKKTMKLDGSAIAMVANPVDGEIAISTDNNSLTFWHSGEQEEVAVVTKGYFTSLSIAFNSKGTRIIAGGGDHKARVWDVANGRSITTLSTPGSPIYSVALNSAATRAVTLGSGDTAKLWTVPGGSAIQTFKLHKARGTTAGFLSDDTKVYVSTDTGTIQSFDVESGKKSRQYVGAKSRVNATAVTSSGTHLLAGTQMGELYLWDVKSGKLLEQHKISDARVMDVAFSADGKYSFTGMADGTVSIREVPMAGQKPLNKISPAEFFSRIIEKVSSRAQSSETIPSGN